MSVSLVANLIHRCMCLPMMCRKIPGLTLGHHFYMLYAICFQSFFRASKEAKRHQHPADSVSHYFLQLGGFQAVAVYHSTCLHLIHPFLCSLLTFADICHITPKPPHKNLSGYNIFTFSTDRYSQDLTLVKSNKTLTDCSFF